MANNKQSKILIINATEPGYVWYADMIGSRVIADGADGHGDWVVDGKIVLSKDAVFIEYV